VAFFTPASDGSVARRECSAAAMAEVTRGILSPADRAHPHSGGNVADRVARECPLVSVEPAPAAQGADESHEAPATTPHEEH
jgi:hypothetical protein